VASPPTMVAPPSLQAEGGVRLHAPLLHLVAHKARTVAVIDACVISCHPPQRGPALCHGWALSDVGAAAVGV